MDLIAELRKCADTPPAQVSPFWNDRARMLMRQAAHALEAANSALREQYERALPVEGK